MADKGRLAATALSLGGLLLFVYGCCCQPENFEQMLEEIEPAEDVPLPADEQVQADLIGQSFVYEGDSMNGRRWTIADGEFRTFEVVARTPDNEAGYADIDVHIVLEDTREVVDGGLRATYFLQEGAWVFQDISRYPDQDFDIRNKTIEKADPSAIAALEGRICDARTGVGMCWEYSEDVLVELGETYAREVCGQFAGSWSDSACPASDRLGSCLFDGYRIYYYDDFKDLNNGLTIIRHCRESGGELRFGGKRGKGPDKRSRRER